MANMDTQHRLGSSNLLIIAVISLICSSAMAQTTSARPPSQPSSTASPSSARPPTVNHSLSSLQVNQTANSKKNNTCNLAVDTVKKDADKPGSFLKCERKTWRPESGNGSKPEAANSSLLIITAEWVPYACSKKTVEECIEEFMLEKNVSKGLFSDFDYDSYANGANSLEQSGTDCRAGSPPSPGAICCASQSARLEIDNTDSQYYLQCVPTHGTQSQIGTWVRMQCPSGMIFNFAAQLCLNAYGSPLSQGPNLTASAAGAPAANLPVCPDGEVSNILCNKQWCPQNYMCHHGVCCPMPQDQVPAQAPQPTPKAGALTTGAIQAKIVKVAQANNQFQCPDGSQPDTPCQTDNECARGYICTSGYCCKSKHVTNLRYQSPCPGYVSPSIRVTTCGTNNQCPSGYFCPYSAGICCPQPAPQPVQQVSVCPGSVTLANPCNTGVSCPPTYYCNVGVCCPQTTTTPCQNGLIPVGPCVNSQCGTGFTCNTATNMCCPSLATTCANGQTAVGNCVGGVCGPGFTCETASNLCCPSVATTTLCPDQTQPAGACIGGLCGTGFTCITGSNICCPGTAATTTRCLDGSTPAGPCVNNLCGVGFTCTTGNLCCPQNSVASTAICPNGQASAGPCVSGLCASPFTCTPENQCCLASAVNTGVCPNAGRSEPCNADGISCPTPGFTCIDGATCCNLNAAAGGSAVTGDCNSVAGSLGPCVNDLCPSQFACRAGCCVPTVAKTRGEPDLTSDEFDLELPAPRRPYISDLWAGPTRGHNYGDLLGEENMMCPGGKPAAAACRYGLCQSGYTCVLEKNLCCPSNPRTAEVAGPRGQGIAPGLPCTTTWQCAGASKQLAACVQKSCVCLPPARSTGSTCFMPPLKSILRPAIGRPYHAHSHVFPGLLSDAMPAGNETANETAASTLAVPTVPTFAFKTLSRTVGCGKSADCDSKLLEQCINGTCIAPKAPGEVCTSKTECIAYCPNTDCVNNGRGARHCVCPDKTYRYGRKCFNKCPKGSRQVAERRECEDVAYSNMLRDSVISYETDVKVTSFC